MQSNCISVEPLETEFGRKRQINQSSCNKDFTCLSGYCPSFVTLYGATPRRKGRTEQAAVGRDDLFAALPVPPVADATVEPYNIVVGGIGGGGVLTIGAPDGRFGRAALAAGGGPVERDEARAVAVTRT